MRSRMGKLLAHYKSGWSREGPGSVPKDFVLEHCNVNASDLVTALILPASGPSVGLDSFAFGGRNGGGGWYKARWVQYVAYSKLINGSSSSRKDFEEN